ncbi:hypothetical protein AGMMS49992_09780 [Clostridia bacterium]|nr:hypothetical protein AGMMS49992_09780 [Clostridia bacterium]
MGMPHALLRMTDISKVFPGVKALDNVQFELRAGEIHALIGENGAGKSTFIKTLTGVHKPDGGEILLDGKPIVIRDPVHAQRLGIAAIYQNRPSLYQRSLRRPPCGPRRPAPSIPRSPQP